MPRRVLSADLLVDGKSAEKESGGHVQRQMLPATCSEQPALNFVTTRRVGGRSDLELLGGSLQDGLTATVRAARWQRSISRSGAPTGAVRRPWASPRRRLGLASSSFGLGGQAGTDDGG